MKKIGLLILLIFFLIFHLFTSAKEVSAQCPQGCSSPLCSGICANCSWCGVNTGAKFGSPFGVSLGFGNLVSIILSNAIVIASIIMLFLLIFGGISIIIISAGSGDAQGAGKGKQAITGAVIGFVIIFIAYWIILIVERITGLKILNPGI